MFKVLYINECLWLLSTTEPHTETLDSCLTDDVEVFFVMFFFSLFASGRTETSIEARHYFAGLHQRASGQVREP